MNSTASDRHPTISSDGIVISFQSSRTGGHGNLDVWNHHRGTGATGQGASQSSSANDLEPSLRWIL